jgi:hypothetical protein
MNVEISELIFFNFWFILIIIKFKENKNYLLLFSIRKYNFLGLKFFYKFNFLNYVKLLLIFIIPEMIFGFWGMFLNFFIFIFTTIKIEKR